MGIKVMLTLLSGVYANGNVGIMGIKGMVMWGLR